MNKSKESQLRYCMHHTFDFVRECQALNITPYIAQNTKRKGGSAIDRRTTRHMGFAISQHKPKNDVRLGQAVRRPAMNEVSMFWV